MASILIAVHGDATLLCTARTRLAAAGHIVGTTQDGADAWELARTGVFDIALLDATLPPLGGLRVVERMRETAPCADTRVALIADDEDARITLLARTDETVRTVLAKPVHAEDLFEALRVHFGLNLPEPFCVDRGGLIRTMRTRA